VRAKKRRDTLQLPLYLTVTCSFTTQRLTTTLIYNKTMAKTAIFVTVLMGLMGIGWGMPPQCNPEVLEEIDNPKIREICHFLQNYAEAVAVEGQGGFVKGAHYPLGLIDGGVKRQDVDHVFLRFGRRRR